MTVEPAALRAIADELEAAQLAAEEQLRGLLNGTLDSQIPTDAPTDGIAQTEEPAAVIVGAHGVATGGNIVGTPDSNPFLRRPSGTKPCPYCGREFKAAGLGIHEAAHRRRGEHLPDPISVPEPLRAHSFLCRYCSKAFPNELDLKVHEASHPAPAKGRPVGDLPTVDYPGGNP